MIPKGKIPGLQKQLTTQLIPYLTPIELPSGKLRDRLIQKQIEVVFQQKEQKLQDLVIALMASDKPSEKSDMIHSVFESVYTRRQLILRAEALLAAGYPAAEILPVLVKRDVNPESLITLCIKLDSHELASLASTKSQILVVVALSTLDKKILLKEIVHRLIFVWWPVY